MDGKTMKARSRVVELNDLQLDGVSAAGLKATEFFDPSHGQLDAIMDNLNDDLRDVLDQYVSVPSR